ncbi:MAG TPA: hypothetical protein VF437_03670 [Verrucomicrobiae bacterium]|jgi:hypothetical protein
MGILFVIVLFALSSWALIALFLRLRRQHTSTGWWVAFGVLIACGVALGIWCAFYCEYHVGTRYRIGSFPIPVVFFHLENGDWVDFPVPEFQAWSAAFTNVITITALATLPLWLVSWRQHRHESRVLESERAA